MVSEITFGMGRKHKLVPRPSVLHMKGESGNKTMGRKPRGEYKDAGIKIINIIHALKHTIGNLSCQDSLHHNKFTQVRNVGHVSCAKRPAYTTHTL